MLRSEGWLQGTLHTVMEEGNVTDMYMWLERLAKNPYTDDELRPLVPGEPLYDIHASVQSQALAVIWRLHWLCQKTTNHDKVT